MENIERILKAFANKRRIVIVQYLKKRKEAPVGEIAGKIHLSFKATSKHLNLLTGAGIVQKEQRGLLVFYSIANHAVPITKSIISFL